MITVKNAITEAERVLWDLLSLGLQRRDTPAANIAALAAYSGMPDRTLVYVADQARVYRYAKDSQAVPDGLNIVQPASLPAASKRAEELSHEGRGGNAAAFFRPHATRFNPP